ncbi:MAG: Fic family protein, partial [Oligoflexia bacterium]|nr:Fic family protein [Oligoflexia bacterium]
PGFFRSGTALTSSFNPNDYNASAEELEYLQKYDILGINGEPMVRFRSLIGRAEYVKSSEVEVEIDALLKEINPLINAIKRNRPLPPPYNNWSPLDLIAYIQKKFVSIHPFHEGIGRTGRLIQDLICQYLELPLIPGGLLQND